MAAKLSKAQMKRRLMEAHDKMIRVWLSSTVALTAAQRKRLLGAIEDIEHIVNGMK